MDFLDQVILDNTIKMYGIVAGTIVLALLVKRYLSRYIASLFYRCFHRVWGNVKKQEFIDLVVQPLQLFILLLVIVFSIDKLNFPGNWTATLYGISLQTLLERAGVGLLIVSFTWVALRLIDFVAIVLEYKANLTADQSDNQLIVFFKDFFKVLVAIAGFLTILKFCFMQAIGPLIAGLGIAGAAIALASKESLENIIASFIIFFDKPFITGDTIRVLHITGMVERIGLRSTRIRTADKTLVSVPNKQMVDSVLDNHTMRTGRRIAINLLLNPRTPAGTLRQVIAGIESVLEAGKDNFSNPSVYVADLTAAGALLVVECFTPPVTDEVFQVFRQELTLAVKLVLEQEKVVMGAVAP